MRNRLTLIVVVFLLASMLHVEAKSTMEMLINKEWYEIDLSKMQTRKDYYVKFTGTQRLIVGADEDGNTKVRVQTYYLSNEKTDIFDEEQVGKCREGKYVVFQGKKRKGYTEAVCMELYQLDDMNMRMGDVKVAKAEQHCFVVNTEEGKDYETDTQQGDGTVISTQDLLVGKTWYEIDRKTGKRKRTEVLFDKDGMALHCTIAKNFKRELPDWQMREFYFSDEIEREFDHSKIGDRENGIYLVMKEKVDGGEWCAVNYDITTLSANRLVLDCVYPEGIPTRTFMTQYGIETMSRKVQKPQQWQLMENAWHRLDTANWQRSHFTERFDSINVKRKYSVIIDGIRSLKETENVYYMSNEADSVFDFSKVGKATEGDYVVVNETTRDGGRVAVSYKVDYLDNKNMLLSAMLDSVEHLIAYERDLTSEEQEQIAEDEALAGKKRTTLDRLSGRQWKFDKKPYATMSKWHRWYFTDSLWAEVDFVYDEIRKVWDASIKTRVYYLSDYAHHNFSFDQVEKKYEGGKYINFYKDTYRYIYIPKPPIIIYTSEDGSVTEIPQRPMYNKIPDRRSYSYEICFLSERLFVYSPTESTFVRKFNMVNR